MSGVAFKTNFSSSALEQMAKGLKKSSAEGISNFSDTAKPDANNGTSFMDHLKEGVNQVNESQHVADKMASDVATGKSQNLHESMLAMTEAELSFNFMVQVRNKALEAYQEIMRMPV